LNSEVGTTFKDSARDQELDSFLRDFLDPWYASLANPAKSQEITLSSLLDGYGKTDYGKKYHKGNTVEEFQKSFPVVDYEGLSPLLEKVRSGDYSSLLPEPPTHWVMTRGTTGVPKIIPATETHLGQILANGARAITNFALKRDASVLATGVLNLNFPSEVGVLKGKQTYGYSSGTYARLFPSLGDTGLVPRQEEIDSLGGGISKDDWERRFDLVYEKAKSAPVGSVMGVTPVLLEFARYLKKKYGMRPKELWRMKVLFCTSVAKIHSKYAPEMRYAYGEAPVVEMYSATEGVFGQQLDEFPYISPNYDTYFFEVRVGGDVKLLCELKPREWGSLIVSSVLFPRYEIGDLVESLGKGYFRVLGRKKTLVKLEHVFYNVLTGRKVLGRWSPLSGNEGRGNDCNPDNDQN
jgi:hypothetical protein